ncbi:MAG: hypothetical protein COA99_05655 [Moraxellaceae bacterium]|nr:MAG: hypothetical protein COA99_05655 [Moraxellaceae bacterium]
MTRPVGHFRLFITLFFLLLVLIGTVWQGAVEFRDVAERTHRGLVGKTVAFVVDDALDALLTNVERIGSDVKQSADFSQLMRRENSRKNVNALTAVLENQFFQRLVTSGQIKLLALRIYNVQVKNVFGIVAQGRMDQVISNTVRHALRSREGSDRYKTLPVFWKADDTTLLYSVFFPLGGLKIHGYLEVVVDPVFSLSKVGAILHQPIIIQDEKATVFYQANDWESYTDEPESLLLTYSVQRTFSGGDITLSLLSDFSSVTNTILNVLIVVGLTSLVVCALAIFFATHVVRSSQLKTLARAAETADKSTQAKARFLANMSHEIRTPINAIVGFTRILGQSELSFLQRDSVGRVALAAKNLSSLVNDLLDFSKIEEEKLELESIPFNLYDEVVKVRSMFSLDASERNIDLLVQVSQTFPTEILGDPLRYNQVLTNLVSNAIKFVDKGSITIFMQWTSFSSQNGEVVISVRDTGIGISKENSADIFNSFSQEDTTTTRKYGGTGLGLAISKQIVQLMGGELTVESELGEGAEFTFVIPVSVKNATSIGGEYGVMSGHEVLLIESSPSIAEFVYNNLGSINVTTTYYPTSDDALTILQQYSAVQYAVALVEWKSYHQPCTQLIEMLKSRSIAKHLIFIIDHSMLNDVESFKAMGVAACLLNTMSNIDLCYSIVEVMNGANLLDVAQREDNKTPTYKGRHCLVVDDNDSNITLLERILETYDIEVTTAINGRDALAAIEASVGAEAALTFDMVLMDMMMPVMDGYTALTHMRKDSRLDDLFVVALTANATLDDKQRCIGMGANAFLPKPLDVDVLEALLAERFSGFEMQESGLNEKGLSGTLDVTKARVVQSIEETSELPSALPGVDINAALERLGGKESLYLCVVQSFTKGYSDFQLRFSDALLDDEADHVICMAHALKGLAGTLGAERLRGVATEVEKRLVERCSVDEILPELFSSLLVVQKSCEQLVEL